MFIKLFSKINFWSLFLTIRLKKLARNSAMSALSCKSLWSYPFKIQKCLARLHVHQALVFFSKPAICWWKVTNVNKKILRHFDIPSIFPFMNCKKLKKILVIGNFKKLDWWPFSDLWRPFWILPKNVNKQLYLRN